MSKIKNSKFFTLSAAAFSVAADLGEDEENFATYLKWAIDGFRKFNFETSYDIRVEEIAMKPHKQIDWPEDMVDWNKIGFRVGDTIKVFTNDNSIPKYFDKINGVPQENAPALSVASTDEFVPFMGSEDFFSSGGSHFYGALVNYNYRGYFDVDNKLRVFNFKQVVNNVNTIYLEFITDGIDYTGQTICPPQAFKCLQDYIHWQRKKHSDDYSDSQAEMAKRDYKQEFDDVLVYNLKMSLDDIKEALRSGNKQTTKS